MAITGKKSPAGSGEYCGISVPMLFLDVAPFDSKALQMKTRPRTNAGNFGQIVRNSRSCYLPQCGHWPFNTLIT
jgi:hypothetical protein